MLRQISQSFGHMSFPHPAENSTPEAGGFLDDTECNHNKLRVYRNSYKYIRNSSD